MVWQGQVAIECDLLPGHHRRADLVARFHDLLQVNANPVTALIALALVAGLVATGCVEGEFTVISFALVKAAAGGSSPPRSDAPVRRTDSLVRKYTDGRGCDSKLPIWVGYIRSWFA